MCRFQNKTKQYTSKITTKAKKQKTKKFTSFQYISPSGSSESGSLQKENCRSEKKIPLVSLTCLLSHWKGTQKLTQKTQSYAKYKFFSVRKPRMTYFKQQTSSINYRLARRAQVNKNMQDQTKVKTSVKKDLSTIVRT